MEREDYQQNKAFYNAFWGVRWRRYWTYSNQTKLRRFRRVIRKLKMGDVRNGRICDFGFGLGVMLFEFDRSNSLIGTELSESAVASAQKVAIGKGYHSVDFRITRTGDKLPKEWMGSCDVVISSHVLEHLSDPNAELAKFVEVLRPGGVACILVPINERVGDDWNHFHLFSKETICDLIRKSSLEILYVEECDRLWKLVFPISKMCQQRPSKTSRVLSIATNVILAPLPIKVLRFIDSGLRLAGVRPAQCIVVARKS